MDKLRFGVIGAGGIADRRTIPGMMLANNATLTAVMELDAGNAEALRQKYGARHAYTSAEELLTDPEVDAVYIASPVVCHAQQAKLAADAGKAILSEKPLALSAGEGQSVVDYCAMRGVPIAAGFMMRFGAYVQAMKREIAAGSIGTIVSAYSQFTLWYPPTPGAWRQFKSKGGGGALMDMGVHCIDLMQFITGSKVTEVAALNDNLTFDYDVEDTSSVLLKLDSGTQCVIQTCFNIPDNAAKWRLEFFGTRGRLMGDGVIGQEDTGSVDAVFLPEVGGYDPTQNTNLGAGSTELNVTLGNMYTREIESFADSVLNDRPLVCPASEAVLVQQVVEAAYLSSAQRRIIEL